MGDRTKSTAESGYQQRLQALPLSHPAMARDNAIKVVARFRPPNRIEKDNGATNVVDFDSEDTCSIQARDGSGAFTFDRVFDTESQQPDVFEYSIRSTVDDIIEGYNGTVFAYGQTGAGKSYTMMGSDIADESRRGLIPRITEQIFASIVAAPANIEWTVSAQYMEIYMEKIRDLLQPQFDNLPIHEDKQRGVYVKDLAEVYASSVQDVYEVLERGGAARATASTNMNQESSRSHSILIVRVAQKNLENGSQKNGRLFLVDLAGSEKVGKTGASGQTLEEAKKINKSLSSLGNVINALTDGKSKHIPYRDSKLTRILQESLGGNSRTTLIINCSPSSYNVEETLSTLRFGERAKKIENKATINQELSPQELKALLKQFKGELSTIESYATSLEGEVQVWRKGESVPEERWTPARKDPQHRKKSEPKPAPGTPARVQSYDGRRAETPTPSRPDSRLEIDRASTPSVILEKDEREDFLRRENELQDEIADKESRATKAEEELRIVKEELQTIRGSHKQATSDNERLQSEANEFKMQVEKISFESKETMITMDSLKDANKELTAELDDVKSQLLEAKISVSETSAALDEKEKKKAERMAQMLAGFDMGSDAFGENEHKVREAIELLDHLLDISDRGEAVVPDDLQDLRKRLVETQGIVRQAELSLAKQDGRDGLASQRLEQRLAEVEKDYEALLEKNLSQEDVESVKQQLGNAYVNRRSVQNEQIEAVRDDLDRTVEDNARLKTEIESLQQRIKSGNAAVNGAMANGDLPGKSIQQQIAEFDNMKKSLMRDLQNRCERVVELEMSLEEAREQYNNVLRTTNNRAQQKKLAFLERNLDQLTHVQRQLVEQNNSLKKEVAIAERKLYARNERIQSLEALLQDSQDKLMHANHRYVLGDLSGPGWYAVILISSQVRDTNVGSQGTPRSCQSRLYARSPELKYEQRTPRLSRRRRVRLSHRKAPTRWWCAQRSCRSYCSRSAG